MDADEMTRYICETFADVDAAIGSGPATGDTFLYYRLAEIPADQQFPWATIVTGDHYDSVSDLTGPGTYRLNIGLPKQAYTALFGAPPARRDEHGVLDAGVDYAARDTLLPHPIYASQYWVCVVNPGPATLDTVRDLLAEAHRCAARKHANQTGRRRQH